MSKMSVTLYTTKPDDGQNLSAEIKEAADAALQHVSERLKGLPIDPEVFIGRAPTAHGRELVVVLLPLRGAAHRDVMGLMIKPDTQHHGPDRVYGECLWHVEGQPEPGQVAARKFLSDLANLGGGTLAGARFNLALMYINKLGQTDEGKD